MICIFEFETKDGTIIQTTIRELDSESCIVGEILDKQGKKSMTELKIHKSLDSLKYFYSKVLGHTLKYEGE